MTLSAELSKFLGSFTDTRVLDLESSPQQHRKADATKDAEGRHSMDRPNKLVSAEIILASAPIETFVVII
jgi:hypothetical protein